MRISLGYPDRAAERELLKGSDRRDMVDNLKALLTPHELLELQQLVSQVHAAEPLLNYLQDLIAATRSGRWFLQGLSPRAGIAIMRAARAQAFLSDRDYVAPDDISAVLPQTAAHRLVPVSDAGRGSVEQLQQMAGLAVFPNPLAPLRRRLRSWFENRLSFTDQVELTQRTVYILPTRPGLMLAATLVVLLVASINYQLNLGYLLTFLLAGSAVVGLFVGGLSFRYGLKGSYFALVTLAFAEVFRILALSVPFTGAGVGL
eukprot:gene52900-64630_t